MIGAILLDQGEFAQGIAALEETTQLAEQAGFAVAIWVGRTLLALFYGRTGRAHQGISLLDTLVTQISTHNPQIKSWSLATLGYLYWRIGDTTQADALIEQAKHDSRLDDLSTFVPMILTLAEGEIALTRQEYTQVLALTTPLLAQYRELDFHPFKCDVMLLASRALRGQGQIDAAREMLRQARAEAETVGVRRVLWEILAEWSTLEFKCGNVLEAQTLRAQAHDLIDLIAARAPDDVRASFLNLPAVRAVIDANPH
jgi:tetratricopeptide (TPR) repeat protein